MNEEEAEAAIIATENEVWDSLPDALKIGTDKQMVAIVTHASYIVLLARGDLVRPGDSPEQSVKIAEQAREQLTFMKMVEDML